MCSPCLCTLSASASIHPPIPTFDRFLLEISFKFLVEVSSQSSEFESAVFLATTLLSTGPLFQLPTNTLHILFVSLYKQYFGTICLAICNVAAEVVNEYY